MINIMIADDHKLVREGLKKLLEFDGDIILTDPLGIDTRLYDIIKDRISENL